MLTLPFALTAVTMGVARWTGDQLPPVESLLVSDVVLAGMEVAALAPLETLQAEEAVAVTAGTIPSSLPEQFAGPVPRDGEETVADLKPSALRLATEDVEDARCRLPGQGAPEGVAAIAASSDSGAFGLALARAARAQLGTFVVYNDRYSRIAYPMGDVHPMYGVCTDVIIRAYRALGIDLQELVQRAKMGSGDPNIDHRRVETLRRFFTRFGEQLPVSDFAEDYQPGDIVTYWRPQNRHSRTHIALVSDKVAASGRPLIIHNRGWGPQEEDGLFVDKITGHYRFRGFRKMDSFETAAEMHAVASSRSANGSTRRTSREATQVIRTSGTREGRK